LCRPDGKLFALPWYLVSPVLFVNQPMLAEGGLSADVLAADWPGFLEQARVFHRETGKFLFFPQLGDESEIPVWMIEAALPMFQPKPDGEKGLRANLTDPKVVAFVRQFVDDYRAGVYPRASASGDHAVKIDQYQLGQIATAVVGPNFMQRIYDAAPQVYAATAVRSPPAWTPKRYQINTQLLSVSSQSKHPREAAELAWFITSHESQLAFCKIVNILPSTTATVADPLFAAPPPDQLETEAGKIAYARHLSAMQLRTAVGRTPALSNWPQMCDVFAEKIKGSLLDGRDVKETLAEIEREWQSILDSNVPATMDALPSAPAIE
jgi:putative chitobiose transport system substrate-binding protein